MTRKICYLMMVAMIFIMSSCGTGTNGGGRNKEKYLKNYTSLVEEFEAKYHSITKEEFDSYVSKLHMFAGEYFEEYMSELTDDERQYVGSLNARADKIIYAKRFNEAKDKVNAMFDVASGYINEIVK